MPYIWIRSFFERRDEKRETKDIPTNDVAALKIEYKTSETTEIVSVPRDVPMQI